MNEQPRYAVYFAPAPGSALAAFGSTVLGYDPHSGAKAPIAAGLAQSFPMWRSHVAEPSRYGFHATLKAPFSLAAGFREFDLLDAAAALAGRLEPEALGVLDVAAMHRFVALLPRDPQAGTRSARVIVGDLDHLRAPLSDADRVRRLQAPLTPRQIAHLDRWGYPYVMDEYRFHMTLAGPLEVEAITRVSDALARHYAAACTPTTIDAITIFKQETRAQRFVAIERFQLLGAAAA